MKTIKQKYNFDQLENYYCLVSVRHVICKHTFSTDFLVCLWEL